MSKANVVSWGNRDKEQRSEVDSEAYVSQPMVYQIRIKGHLDLGWRDWFGGMSITMEESGDTLLTGLVVDQAALYGLLKIVRNSGMALLSVNSVKLSQVDASDVKRLIEMSDFLNDSHRNLIKGGTNEDKQKDLQDKNDK